MVESKQRNLVAVGLWGTLGWTVFCIIYIHLTTGWAAFVAMPANNLGDFLSGGFAPLAFMWLALGLFIQAQQLELQRSELSLQREELKLQREETARLADEAARQAKAIEASEQSARQDAFIRLLDVALPVIRSLARDVALELSGIEFNGTRLHVDSSSTEQALKQGSLDVYCDKLAVAADITKGAYIRHAFETRPTLAEKLKSILRMRRMLHVEARSLDVEFGEIEFVLSCTTFSAMGGKLKEALGELVD